MDISFDAAKDTTNLAKHGLSLRLAAQLDWPTVMAGVDARRDYREVREIGFGVIADRLYCVVFTQRGDAMHIISLRKATQGQSTRGTKLCRANLGSSCRPTKRTRQSTAVSRPIRTPMKCRPMRWRR
ncbi:BrnT family toxin [Cupriavidus oxalaticus]|uniref:BrnT family toxin n=1 Tax=Cupriavidus oxalaticus TaxID=96344 RepID=UPI003D18528B